MSGDRIPLYARIALLAQVVDVFNNGSGTHAAVEEIRARRGGWFDPELCDAFDAVAKEAEFWAALDSPDIEAKVVAMEPANSEQIVDEDYLDDIAEAFGQVVNAKSPYTAGHSARVALYTTLLSEAMDIPESRRRWLKRGALLHDVGKLGVSNSILDKPGKLDEDEWEAVKRHAAFTGAVLSRLGIFDELARVSSAHHERLDGKGYPLGLMGNDIALETRIITTSDIFDAITAKRPYRDAVPVEKTLSIMSNNVGSAIDPHCFEHLKNLIATHPEFFPE